MATELETVPRAAVPLLQHALDTYASEAVKTANVWRSFGDADLAYRPHARASTVDEILRHQLLSERRFFAEFLGVPEPAAAEVLPADWSVAQATERYLALASARLPYLARQDAAWWEEVRPFFDVQRERIWIFWRRVLHTAHHRTQLTVCLKLLDRSVPSTYGPTADVTWSGADPTHTVAAAERR